MIPRCFVFDIHVNVPTAQPPQPGKYILPQQGLLMSQKVKSTEMEIEQLINWQQHIVIQI